MMKKEIEDSDVPEQADCGIARSQKLSATDAWSAVTMIYGDVVQYRYLVL